MIGFVNHRWVSWPRRRRPVRVNNVLSPNFLWVGAVISYKVPPFWKLVSVKSPLQGLARKEKVKVGHLHKEVRYVGD